MSFTPALLRCCNCGRASPANRSELLSYARSGLPHCCGAEMDLYLRAERPLPEDARVVALPLALPDSNEDTATGTVAHAPAKPGGAA